MTFGDQCSENLANFFSKLITLFIYLSLSRDSCYLYLSFLVLACLSIDRGKRKYRFVESTDVVEAADEERAEEESEAAWPPSDAEDDTHHVADVEEDDTDDLVTDAAPETDTVIADAHSPDRTAQTLSEKIATLETLVASRSDEWEPDDPGADAYAGTEAPTLAWEDAETAATPTFSHHAKPAEDAHDAEAEDTLEDDDAQVFSSDEDVLDEDALRDLVADIVREELQGALGERITRNVRKLVRREIHRALAAQELE